MPVNEEKTAATFEGYDSYEKWAAKHGDSNGAKALWDALHVPKPRRRRRKEEEDAEE